MVGVSAAWCLVMGRCFFPADSAAFLVMSTEDGSQLSVSARSSYATWELNSGRIWAMRSYCTGWSFMVKAFVRLSFPCSVPEA